jgi:hypothetical protein
MTNTNSRNPLRRIACPQCGEVGLQKIIYGMPSDDFNFDKFIVGGCIVSEADIGCPKCEWSGIRNELEQS